MGCITFIDGDLGEREVKFSDGESVMTVAVNNDVAGIEGECGGEMSCGTCHVYVSQAWLTRVPRPSAEEVEMLEVVDDQRPESRLGCQITLTGEMDGIVVTVAEQTL